MKWYNEATRTGVDAPVGPDHLHPRVNEGTSMAKAHPMRTECASQSSVKTCSQCETEKPFELYPPDLRRKDGCGSKCRDCVRVNKEAYYARYPAAEATRRQRNAEHGAAWYRRNRATQVERMKWNHLVRSYGISREDYQRLLAEQDGKCAICFTSDPGRRDAHFAVDHDHDTGIVRGLLCQKCNSGVGFFCDNPDRMRRAAEYVERSRQQPATLQVTQTGAD